MNYQKWHKIFPEKLSPNIKNIIKIHPDGAVAKQFLNSEMEFENNEYAIADALGEAKHEKIPGLIHFYPNRVLLHFAPDCPARCRFCFRKNSFDSRSNYNLLENIDLYADYLKDNKHISDILISGGDPISLDLEVLDKTLAKIRKAAPQAIIRFCSRGPLTAPEKITREFVQVLKQNNPLWFVYHVNHCQELNKASLEALELLRQASIPILAQTVLLKGINDNVDELSRLFNKLVFLGIKPYYLFQADAVSGTAGYRTDLFETIKIYEELSHSNGGLALPSLAMDLPGGGGKIKLIKEKIIDKKSDYYLIKRSDGAIFKYPC